MLYFTISSLLTCKQGKGKCPSRLCRCWEFTKCILLFHGAGREQGRSKKTSLYFFFHKNLHLPPPGSCSQLHSAQQLQEQAGLPSPRAWFAFPGPSPSPWQPRGLILPPPPQSCGTATGLPPPELSNQPHRACSSPPALTDPTESRGLWMGPHSFCMGTKEARELPLYK